MEENQNATKLTCMIVDDEPLAIRLLENFINKTPYLTLKASYDNSIEALHEEQINSVNILFLDIQLPDLDGMELSRMVPEETRIIFTTAFKQYAFESYEVSALDFLLKPISYKKFLEATAKAVKWFERTASIALDIKPDENSDFIFVKSNSQLVRVDIRTIAYVSSMKDYTRFFFNDGKRPLTALMTMKAVEELLPVSRFMRVHRSYIVSLDKISSIDRNNCIYICNEVIRVSDAYRDAFSEYLKSKS